MRCFPPLAGLLLALLLPFAAPAQDGGGPSAEGHSLLWRVTGGGLTDTSWVYGTIHLISQEDFYVRPEIEMAMAASERMAMELKLNDLSLMLKMVSMLKLPGDTTLEDLVDAERYARLVSLVEDSMGQDMATYARQKPMALLQMLILRMIPGTPASYEMDFLQRAVAANQEIVGLETIEDQMAVFDAIPVSEQVDWILDLYGNEDSMRQVYGALVAAYKAEDLEELGRLMTEESPELAAYGDALLVNRNRAWIPRIEALAAEGSVFVAVGAGHLPGEQGVLRLLREAGYTVEPVPPSAERPTSTPER